jgi:hypothetical protein
MNAGMFLIALAMVSMGTSDVTPSQSKTGEIVPTKGFIVLTRAAWGCLRGQDIAEDVSERITREDGESATIYEIKNPEDVSDRYELYLLFAAKPVNGLPGDLVVKLRSDSDKPQVKASLSLNQARLYSKKDQWFLSLKLKGNGLVHSRVLYSRQAEIRQAWFSCPEAGDLQPHKLSFFSAYTLDGLLGGMVSGKLNGKWQALDLQLPQFALDKAIKVDRCQELLGILEKQFGKPSRPLVWQRQKIDAGSIHTVAEQLAESDDGEPFQILLRLDDRTSIHVGSDNFVPHLRQKLAVENPDGKLVGAELLLSAD